jgi:hypothetical protein
MSDHVFGRAYPGDPEPDPLWPHDPRPRPGFGPDLLVAVFAVAMLIALALAS